MKVLCSSVLGMEILVVLLATSLATSMEMAGLSITVFKLDAELKELLLAPASTPFYTNSNK